MPLWRRLGILGRLLGEGRLWHPCSISGRCSGWICLHTNKENSRFPGEFGTHMPHAHLHVKVHRQEMERGIGT